MSRSPSAIGRDTVPTRSESSASFKPGRREPSPRPPAIASAIQSGSRRSSVESRETIPASSATCLGSAPAGCRSDCSTAIFHAFGRFDRLLEQTLDEREQPRQLFAIDAVAHARAFDLASDEPGVLQHSQVFRDGRLRERQELDELPAEVGLPRKQNTQDANAGRVPERLRESGEIALPRGRHGRPAGLYLHVHFVTPLTAHLLAVASSYIDDRREGNAKPACRACW